MQAMGLHDYHFVTQWRFEADAGRLYDLLTHPENFKSWIHRFSIRTEPLAAGDADGVGRTVRFTVQGFLPYSLQWEMRCLEAKRPFQFISAASGDLEGRGIWTFTSRRDWTDVAFDWKVTVRKPLLRVTALLFRPFFAWNHDWIMDRWEQDIRRVLKAPESQ
jgi:hypothetical protein